MGVIPHLTEAVNFIIIQPDDMDFYEAWSPPPHLPWTGSYPGVEYPGLSSLPNINKLRENGLEMTQAYTASPKCGTSRYSTVTGRYASRSSHGRLWSMGERGPSDVSIPNTKLRDVVRVDDGNDCSNGNLAQVFRKNGYKTAMVGKWHLTRNRQAGDFISVEGVKQEIMRCGFQDVNAMYPANMNPLNLLGWYNGDYSHNMEYVAYKAIEFIEENTDNDWFLYINPTMPHSPDVFEAMSHSCLVTPDGDFSRSEPHDWSVIGMTAEFGNDCMAYREDVNARAQTIDNSSLGAVWIDDAVGAVYKALQRTGQLADTLILFQLDHGKAGKDQIWEGGIRIPQFIHYPKELGSSPRQFHGLVSTIDIGPTFLDFAGLDDSSIGWYDMDGQSWKDAVNDSDLEQYWQTNRCLFFESSRERSLRCGCIKYVLLNDSSGEKEDAATAGWWNENEVMFGLCDDQGDYIVADSTTESPETTNILPANLDLANEFRVAMQCHLEKTDADVYPIYIECSVDSKSQLPFPTKDTSSSTAIATDVPPSQTSSTIGAGYTTIGTTTSVSSTLAKGAELSTSTTPVTSGTTTKTTTSVSDGSSSNDGPPATETSQTTTSFGTATTESEFEPGVSTATASVSTTGSAASTSSTSMSATEINSFQSTSGTTRTFATNAPLSTIGAPIFGGATGSPGKTTVFSTTENTEAATTIQQYGSSDPTVVTTSNDAITTATFRNSTTTVSSVTATTLDSTLPAVVTTQSSPTYPSTKSTSSTIDLNEIDTAPIQGGDTATENEIAGTGGFSLNKFCRGFMLLTSGFMAFGSH